MINFSIVIPVYNEEENISNLVYEIHDALNGIKNSFEIIIINDGSNDNTKSKLKTLSTKFKIKLIENNKNFGQSYSILKGIENSVYNNIITIDGDGQNNPYDIPKLVNIYQKQDLHLISGIRKKRRDTFVKIISSKIANKVRSIILKDNCIDTGCSLKLFDKNFFLNTPFFNGIHRFIPALFIAHNCKIDFIDVDHRPRTLGISKYGTFDRLYRGIIDMFKVIKIIKQIKKDD